MAKRRGNNEGCLTHRENGTWRASITLQGKRLTKTVKTRQEAYAWIKLTQQQIETGLTYASTKLIMTEFLGEWIETEQAILKPSTWSHYQQLIRQHISPRIGRITLKDLKTEHIQGLYNRLNKEGIGAYTIQKTHTLLHSSLEFAVKMGTIPRNPASYAKPPKAPEKEMQILNETQANQFLVSALEHRWSALFHLAMVTGMRQMELLGLKWEDLDWLRQTIKVERQLVRTNGKNVEFSTPKTKFGKRSLKLAGNDIQVLRRHSERQQALRVKAGKKWVENGLIFTNSVGGPINPRNLLREFTTLLAAAGLPRIRFHDLRHTAASLMLNHGIPPLIVSRRLGHSRVSITLDIYGHLIPGMQTEAASLISDLVTPLRIVSNCTQTVPELYPVEIDQITTPQI
ncbi:MAG: hypothetical protein C3F13_04545 [Anaerolineales bacterium]|nr:MAG: hypothetical protein C3F13_04545 [Anaerolineales bacterium]